MTTDIAATVAAKARAAKEASRHLPWRPRAPRTTRSPRWRAPSRRRRRPSSRPIAPISSARAPRATRGPSWTGSRSPTTRIDEMAAGIRQVAALPDPGGRDGGERGGGRTAWRSRACACRSGVVGFIYESRPNVTADAAALCLKSGNAVVLRGGSEALESNTVIAQLLAKAVEKAGLPADAVQYVDTPDRPAVMAMLTLDRYLDLIIPRGGEEFVRLVAERATVPVLKHDKGLCHVYVDEGADLDMAVSIAVNAKAQRVSVCNARGDAARARRRRAALPRRRGGRGSPRPAWSCAATRARGPSCPARAPRRTRTGTPSTSTTSSPCAWSTASTRRWRTSAGTARGSPRPS